MRKIAAKQQLSQITESIHERNINPSYQSTKTPAFKPNRPQSTRKFKGLISQYSANQERDSEKSVLSSLNRWKSPNVIYSFRYEQMHKEHSLSNIWKKNVSTSKFDESSERLTNTTSPTRITQDPPFRMRETIKRYLYDGEYEDSYQKYLAFSKHFSNIMKESRQMSAAINSKLEINENKSAARLISEYTAQKIRKSIQESSLKKSKAIDSPKQNSIAPESPQLLKLKSATRFTTLDKQIVPISTIQNKTRSPSNQTAEVVKALSKPKQMIRIKSGKVLNLSNRMKASHQQKKVQDIRKDLANLAEEYFSNLENKEDNEERLMLKRDIDRLKNELNQKKSEQSKGLMIKLADTVFRCANKLKMFKLSLEEVLTTKIFSSKPFERPGSEVFINACRDGNLKVAERCLRENRYLAFEFDHKGRTGMHSAAFKGYSLIAKVIVQVGADLDARDVGGRTPLMLAAKGGDVNTVQLLIEGGANLDLQSDGRKLAIDFASDTEIQKILNKSLKRSIQRKKITYTTI